ncbi:putative nuclease HARBI1 [Ruditapes philippinarum]|jgi:hypothetical protein|uniref:putative nuclease HARBI1 n=1 Tax=Ruditapes philippinarum TaxID=129788 RepID=UPI00295A5ECE|nr:putative nuclease HARBI1 [Ruditapes philippinarum]
MAELVAALQGIFEDEDKSDASHVYLSSRNHAIYAQISGVLAFSTLRHEKSRIRGYVETVYRQYTIDDFKDRFRMNRDTFEKLLHMMSPFLKNSRGVHQITAEKKLLLFIKYLSTQTTFQQLADIFGVCETSVHSVIHDVSEMICVKLLPELIKWPTGKKAKETIDGFQQLAGFPGIMGTIDGSHIPIRTPSEFPENYINRKQYPSIVLQAVCDSKLLFIDVFCGWPGSVHDSRILKNSPLMDKIEADVSQVFPGNTHLLGDSAYALASWMMVPYKDCGNLNKDQKTYNYIHSSTRMCIERAFGALKGRFRRLKFIDLKDISCIVHIVLSCCTLHQLCVQCREDLLDYITEGMAEADEANYFENFMPLCSSAEMKRKTIVCTLK